MSYCEQSKEMRFFGLCSQNDKGGARLGQSILEYAVIIGVVGIALGSMQLYFRRGIQAVIKTSADQMGTQKDSEETDPEKGRKTSSQMNTKTNEIIRKRDFEGGTRQVDYDRKTSTTGTSAYK